MAPSHLLFLGTLSAAERRLAWGLAMSLAVHLLIASGVRPRTAVYEPRLPLQVELREVQTEQAAPLSVAPAPEAPADLATAAPAATPVEPERARLESGALPEVRSDPRLPIERYFTSQDVDVRAEPLNDPPLVYPQRAYQMRLAGKVRLRVLINERGGVDEVRVLEAEPSGVFEEAALDAARALEFSPATRFGRRVKSQKVLEVAFDPYQNINIP